jgi:hypothetical protein
MRAPINPHQLTIWLVPFPAPLNGGLLARLHGRSHNDDDVLKSTTD